ncbi:MAG: TRAP transporter small permease subunit [Rhodospirillaceae bacterium]|nr:TRAP transporter small permease subunit [Rhodospirillaceae bacterium]
MSRDAVSAADAEPGTPAPGGTLWADRVDVLNRWVGRTVRWAVLGVMLIQFGAVVMRYVFGTSEIFVQESILYLHAFLFMLGAGYTLLHDGHVRVDIFYGEASPRGRAWVDLLGTLFLLMPTCLALIWYTLPSAINAWSILEGPISVGGIPASFLLKSLPPVFAALILIQGLAMALRAAAGLARP